MKFSIFPQAAQSTNWTQSKDVQAASMTELAAIITNEQYSPGIFKKNYCNIDNFLSAEFIALDYDNKPDEIQLSLEKAKKLFAPYRCVIATTRHNLKEKRSSANGPMIPAAERFRVILPLSAPVTDTETYYATWAKVAEAFPGVDDSTKDPARRLFKSIEIVMINEEGQTFSLAEPRAPKLHGPAQARAVTGIRGKLSRATSDFLINGSPPGHWNNALFKAARDAHEQGYTEEEFTEKALKIEGYLDTSSYTTINSAFKREPKYTQRGVAPVEVWARRWLEDNYAEVSFKTGGLTVNGKHITADLLIARLRMEAIAYAKANTYMSDKGKEVQPLPYGERDIQHVVLLWQDEQKERAPERVKAAIEYKGENTAITEWLRALTGQALELDVAVMKHFVWQVKRKLYGLPVEWHMMPVVVGKSGGGKSEAIKKLLAPVDEIVTEPQGMEVFSDSREAFVLGKFYICFIDEMSNADRVDVAAMKNKITSATIAYRRLGTNVQINEPNRATFIGTSNKTVQELIFDPTSARRFWEIRSQDGVDVNNINNINYLDVWRSVDKDAECPIKPYLSEIFKVQEAEIRQKSYVELWLEEWMNPDTEQWSPSSELYESFKSWMEWQGMGNRLPTHSRFGRELSKLVPKNRMTGHVTYKLVARQLPGFRTTL